MSWQGPTYGQWFCPHTLGRYPRLPKEIPSETVGEGSGYLSGGPVGEILDMGYMGVSENNGTPKSSILIGFSIINHPFWGTTIFGLTPIWCRKLQSCNVVFFGETWLWWCQHPLGGDTPKRWGWIFQDLRYGNFLEPHRIGSCCFLGWCCLMLLQGYVVLFAGKSVGWWYTDIIIIFFIVISYTYLDLYNRYIAFKVSSPSHELLVWF